MKISRNGKSLIGYPTTTQGVVVLDIGISEIAAYAFCGCKDIADVLIPDGVETIGACAFWDCQSLRSIFIPASVKEIKSHMFGDHHSLTPVSLYFEGDMPENVDDIKYQLGEFARITCNVPEEWYKNFIIQKGTTKCS